MVTRVSLLGVCLEALSSYRSLGSLGKRTFMFQNLLFTVIVPFWHKQHISIGWGGRICLRWSLRCFGNTSSACFPGCVLLATAKVVGKFFGWASLQVRTL